MKRRINLKKVFALLVAIICILFMLNDALILLIKSYTYTWLGFMMFGFAYFICAYSINYLKQNKKD